MKSLAVTSVTVTDRIFGRYYSIPAVIRRGLLEPVLLGMADRNGQGILGRAQDISGGRTCESTAVPFLRILLRQRGS